MVPINDKGSFQYTRHYKAIDFTVSFTYRRNDCSNLFFTAKPIKSDIHRELPLDYIYGKIDSDFKLQIGIREFQIEMTKDLHERLGQLYDEIRNEYVELNNKHL
ncbi:hypothetical protein [Arenibacter sp. S6351L]|uniref:hypothetical protein n=1 Tax=Arenibacter sp. S6351L TaxID=2926407 RepID=UPI001FF31699|nr:hypothetical protein [Arenibacter sp. S6351L]MCK0136054.1 hypothetical protein [Arenibacter sp. S6351L]